MSQLPKSDGGESSKREAHADAAQSLTDTAAVNRVARQRTGQSGFTGVPAAAAASSSVVSIGLSALMRLAVVERQLIMQALDLTSLTQLASTCVQLSSESLHPQCGRFHTTTLPSFPPAASVVKPTQLQHLSHLSPVIRAHRPMAVRLDGLCALPASDRASTTEALLQRVASFRRVVSLSLWDSPTDWTADDALRLLSLVQHSLQLVWGVRSGSIWIEDERVQQALFSLPHLTTVRGLDMSSPDGALLPSALARAERLHTVLVTLPPNPSVLRPLAALPALTRLEICCDADYDFAHAVNSSLLRFPHVRECEITADGWPEGGGDHRSVLMHFLTALSALELLQLTYTSLADNALDCCVELGPQRLPNLHRVVLHEARLGSEIVRAFLTSFLHCELRISPLLVGHFRKQQVQLTPCNDCEHQHYQIVKLR